MYSSPNDKVLGDLGENFLLSSCSQSASSLQKVKRSAF